MPSSYAPSSGDNNEGHSNGNREAPADRRRSRQDSRALRPRRSIVDIGRDAISDLLGNRRKDVRTPDHPNTTVTDEIQTAQTLQAAAAAFPYEAMDPSRHEGQHVNGYIVYPNRTTIFGTTDDRPTSMIGNLARRLTSSGRRNQGRSVAPTQMENGFESVSHADDPRINLQTAPPRSVPMERSLAQSQWRRLNQQRSMPNLHRKRRQSASEQTNSQDRVRRRKTGTFRKTRVSMVKTPNYRAEDYRQDIEDIERLRALHYSNEELADELDADVEMFDAQEGPSSREPPRQQIFEPENDLYMWIPEEGPPTRNDSGVQGQNIRREKHADVDALAALEGRAPHDDGRDFAKNRKAFIDHMGPAIDQYVRIDFDDDDDFPRALAKESDDKPADLSHFSNEQRRVLRMSIIEAGYPDGFEFEVE